MKRPIYTVILVVLSFVISAESHAQSRFFAGGQLGISAVSTESHMIQTELNSFSVAPEFGYQLKNDRWQFGLRLSYSSAYSNDMDITESVGDVEFSFSGIDSYNRFGFNPFAAYRCFNLGPVEVWLEGDLSYYYASNNNSAGGVVYLDGNIFGINVTPVLSWRPTDHFSFFSELNVLSLGYSHSDIIALGQDEIASSFSFGVDSNSLLDLSEFTIGFRYWF